jgi:hypothetical protein
MAPLKAASMVAALLCYVDEATGFYIFNAFGDMGRNNYVGSHIRPRIMAPMQWHWPVGVSVSFEGGFVKDGFDADTWTLEVRPIIDKQLGPVYQIGKVWAPGIEYYGSWGPFEHFDPIAVQQHQLAIAVDADFDPRWEFNAGYVFGLTPSIDRSIFKVIVGRRFGGKKHVTHQAASLQTVGRRY